jgi:hypothetical protein
VSVIVPAGILISICGIYLSLSERAAGLEPPDNDTEPGEPAQQRFPIPRATIFHSLTFVGLAILGLAHASTDELTTSSAIASGTRGSVFFLGASLALAGAIGAVFAATARMVALSVAILGVGAAAVLGVSGNALAGAISLTVAAVSAWWLHIQSRNSTEGHSPDHANMKSNSGIPQALSVGRQNIPEPLLTSVAIVMFCWILGTSLHSAIVEESGVKSGMNGSSRALPRAAYEVEPAMNQGQHVTNDAGGQPGSRELASMGLSRDDWLFWCAAGLLVMTVGVGYLRSDSDHDCVQAAEADEA